MPCDDTSFYLIVRNSATFLCGFNARLNFLFYIEFVHNVGPGCLIWKAFKNVLCGLFGVHNHLGIIGSLAEVWSNHKQNSSSLISALRSNNTVSLTYNGLGQKIGMNDPDKDTRAYWYNSFGELTTLADATFTLRGTLRVLKRDPIAGPSAIYPWRASRDSATFVKQH
jgi:YD repeat-containing protein